MWRVARRVAQRIVGIRIISFVRNIRFRRDGNAALTTKVSSRGEPSAAVATEIRGQSGQCRSPATVPYRLSFDRWTPTYPALYSSNFRITTQAFWPPKPKLFERTVLTSTSRATFGT